MITAGDFRNGRTFEFEGNVYQIVEFQHVKPGKGAAFVRTKLKNIINGGVVEKTFRPTEKFEEARIERKDMAYSYGDDDFYHFMDNETFDMLDIAKDEIEDAMKFVKENDVCKVMSYKGNVFGVEPRHLLSFKSLKQNRVLQEILQLTQQSRLLLKQAQQFRFRCLLT
jgi:elongation factor P